MSRLISSDSPQLSNALTVAQLIEELHGCPPNAVVLFGCDYGDYSHTEQALPITEVEVVRGHSVTVVESAYSHSRMAFHEVGDDDDVTVEQRGKFVRLR